MKHHISYSEFRQYQVCPYLYKLQYVDGIDLFEDNMFFAFGKALHKVAEVQLGTEEEKDWRELFELTFLQYLMEIKKKNSSYEFDEILLMEMRAQGKILAPIIKSSLKEYFGDFEVLGREKEFYEEIRNLNLLKKMNFKGFIDLVIKTKKDNKVIILDFKSSTFGWYGRDRNDKLKLYQLIYYKHFYAQKYNIDLNDIETYFCLLKRTVKKDYVEIFKITSGEKRINNALQLLEKSINSIIEGKFWKNKRSCGKCKLYDTELCKKYSK